MKPSSAMALASRISGHSALACAFAGTGVVVAIVIAASAAERRRSRFVNMMPLLIGDDWVRPVANRKQTVRSNTGKRTLPASSFGSVAGRGCCVLSNCCFDTAQRRGHGEHSEELIQLCKAHDIIPCTKN